MPISKAFLSQNSHVWHVWGLIFKYIITHQEAKSTHVHLHMHVFNWCVQTLQATQVFQWPRQEYEGALWDFPAEGDNVGWVTLTLILDTGLLYSASVVIDKKKVLQEWF